jgi:hypothetical protein
MATCPDPVPYGPTIPSEWKDGRISFAVGTGRCGTRFLYTLLAQERVAASSHERHPLNQTFHRYTTWYGLPVDQEGFLSCQAEGIQADLSQRRYSFEASAYLSFSIPALRTHFGAKFILLVRHPTAVIRSYLQKGWYDHSFYYRDHALAPGYQPSAQFHHFLGRIVPMGAAFDAWHRLTRPGKLAWYWNTVNQAVLDAFALLPPDQARIQRLEDLDFAAYTELCQFLGIQTRLRAPTFQRIQRERPNRSSHQKARQISWSAIELSEIRNGAGALASRFGYALAP